MPETVNRPKRDARRRRSAGVVGAAQLGQVRHLEAGRQLGSTRRQLRSLRILPYGSRRAWAAAALGSLALLRRLRGTGRLAAATLALAHARHARDAAGHRLHHLASLEEPIDEAVDLRHR